MSITYLHFIGFLIILLAFNCDVDGYLRPFISRPVERKLSDNFKAIIKPSSVRHNTILKSILDDDEVYTDFETMNSDNELEKKMARELYDELRAGQLGLSIESFMKWEDIEDVLDNGIIDEETMEIIIDEVGVKNGILTFEQFYELVELVNQVSIALDDDEELLRSGSDSDKLRLEKEGEEEDRGNEEAYKWLIDAVSLGQGLKKKDEKDDTQH